MESPILLIWLEFENNGSWFWGKIGYFYVLKPNISLGMAIRKMFFRKKYVRILKITEFIKKLGTQVLAWITRIYNYGISWVFSVRVQPGKHPYLFMINDMKNDRFLLRLLSEVRGGPCNPSYWEDRIWGWLEDGGSPRRLLVPLGRPHLS